MSFSKADEIHAEIDGKKYSVDQAREIYELSDGHFLVKSGKAINEIFLSPENSLSDGNSLDGIEIKIESEKGKIIRSYFNEQPRDIFGSTKGMTLKAPMPGMVRAIFVSVGDK